jgi:hypothetical protein
MSLYIAASISIHSGWKPLVGFVPSKVGTPLSAKLRAISR